MHSILIPTDFTDRSKATIEYVLTVFPPDSNKYVLLHTRSTIKVDEILISIDDILENNIQNNLQKEADYLRSLAGEKADVELVSDTVDLISAVNNYCINNQVDLIALGPLRSHIHTEISQIMGLVRGIKTSLLLVPGQKTFKRPSHILFATRLNGIAKKDIRELLNLIKSCDGHVDILNVGIENPFTEDLPAKLEKMVNGNFKGIDFSTFSIQDNDPFRAITNFSEEKGCDLISLIYRKHNFIDRLIKESITEKILSYVQKPVLVLKSQD